MGVGAITIIDTSFDLTPYVERSSFSIEFQANRLIGVADFVARDESGALLGKLVERTEIAVTDDAVRIYGGQIATIKPSLDGGAVEYRIKLQSFDCLLDQRIIESGVRDRSGGPQYDDDDVVWIASFAADLGLTASSFISRLRTLALPAIDYSSMTLRQALDALASYCGGATYWVDQNKAIHWLDPVSAQLVKNPDFENAGVDWSVDGSATVDDNAGAGGTGDAALTVTGTGAGTHPSTQTVSGITGSRRYMVFADVYADLASTAVVSLDWQDASSVSQRVDTLDNGATVSAWVRTKSVLTAPAAATKVVVTLRLPSGSTHSARWDNVSIVGEDAAFGVSTAPDGSVTQKMWGWEQPSDAATPINRVLVQGNGISGWREHAASIAYFGRKFEGFLQDDRVTTSDGLDSRAAYVFAKYAFPAHSGKYQTNVAGLVPGTWQIVDVQPLSLLSIEWIATIKTTFDGNGNMLYAVTYGTPSNDMGAVMASVGSAFSQTVGVVGVADPHIPGADSVPPAVPTGLALSTGSREGVDGAQVPYLIASWTAVADVDLDAYELAIDRAITSEVAFTASASGTGGALPAGDYAVVVTGVGAVSGETAVTSAPQIVTVAAGQRLYVNITALTGCPSYKVYASILAGSETEPQDTGQTTSTTGSDVEVPAAGAGAVYPPSSSTALGFTNPTTGRMRDVSYYTEDLLGGTYYGARVRAVDASGNASAWSSLATATAALDTSAPVIPTGVSLTTGYRLIGVRWQRNSEADLAFYQVRYAPESSPGSGVPDTTAWTRLTTATNWVLITGLDAGSADGASPSVTYFVQVRAIDRSNNVQTSATDPTAVDATISPEAGWSNDGTNEAYISAVPVLLSGQTDVAYASIVSEHIAASGLDAGTIKTGTLSVGGQPNMADFLLVYDVTGREIGRWDQNGLVVKDPSNTNRQVRIVNGVLSFSSDGGSTWTTALSADGIKADAIKLGTAPGGHNAVPNASFELAAFATALTNGWEANSPWGTTIGTDVNVTKNTADLRLTTYTF